MTDKEFGRKPKFGPVSKKGPPNPLPKTVSAWAGLRSAQSDPRV
jgi:hypothetical protein